MPFWFLLDVYAFSCFSSLFFWYWEFFDKWYKIVYLSSWSTQSILLQICFSENVVLFPNSSLMYNCSLALASISFFRVITLLLVCSNILPAPLLISSLFRVPFNSAFLLSACHQHKNSTNTKFKCGCSSERGCNRDNNCHVNICVVSCMFACACREVKCDLWNTNRRGRSVTTSLFIYNADNRDFTF